MSRLTKYGRAGVGVLLAYAFLLLMAQLCQGGDLTKGYTFAAGQSVDFTDLNDLVDDATINSSFLTGKTLDTTPSSSAGYLLYYDTGISAWRKTRMQDVIGHDLVINGRSDLASMATNDYFLIYDTSATALKKVNLLDGIFQNMTSAWHVATALVDGPATNAEMLVFQDNIVQAVDMEWAVPGTNWASSARVYSKEGITNTDQILIWDAATGSNAVVTLKHYYTNFVDKAVADTNDQILVFDNDNDTIASLRVNDIITLAQSNTTSKVYSTNVFSDVLTDNGATNAHSAGALPTFWGWELVCITADGGYAIGDVIKVDTILWSDGGGAHQPPTQSANATDLHFVFPAAIDQLWMIDRTDGSYADNIADAAKFQLRSWYIK